MLDHYRELETVKDQEAGTDTQPVRQEHVVVIAKEIRDDKDVQSAEIQDGGQNTVSKESMEQMGAKADGILRKIMQAYEDDTLDAS